MTARPNLFPSWATNNPNGIAVPSSADQAVGFSPNQPPLAEHCNWLANTTGQWLQYLDEQGSSTVLASSLDYSTRLVGGGAWSLSGTTLAWSAPAFIAIPSSPDAANTIAAGSVSVPAGSVAFVTANMPYSTQAATTSGSPQLTNVLYGDMAAVGQTAVGSGIPAGATVQSVSTDGQTITLSANATATASSVSVTFASSGTLTVGVAASATFVPGPNTVIFARAVGNGIIIGVGSGQMLLRNGEAKGLLGSGFTESASLTAGAALAANVPVYLSTGTLDGGRTAGAVYPLDVSATAALVRATFLGFTATAVAAGGAVEIVQRGKLNGFSSLTPGALYYGNALASTSGLAIAPQPTSLAGSWNSLVGIALSATQMLVTAGAAPSQLLAPTYSAEVSLGGFFSQNFRQNTVYGTRETYFDVTTSGSTTASAFVSQFGTAKLSMSAKLLAASIALPSAAGVGVAHTVRILRNGVTWATFTITTGAGGGTYTSFSGLSNLAANDTLTANVSFPNDDYVSSNGKLTLTLALNV